MEQKKLISQVSNPLTKENLACAAQSFQAGQVKNYIDNWAKITQNPEVLELISGAKIQFESVPDSSQLYQRNFNNDEAEAIDQKIINKRSHKSNIL